ncbi:MAG: trigger factor [Candidatus Binatota bacterium]|nr:trigger factor [Candidatus Binatota bacterium]
MQVSVEELNPTQRRIAIEVPAEDVTAELDRAFGRLRGEARIKGFRPGRVPRQLLERYYGDQVRADVLSHLIEHSYAQAIQESGIAPIAPPEIVPESLEIGKPLRYSATVEIQPPVEIQEWEGLPGKRLRRAVTDQDVEHALEQVRQSLAELRPVEDRDEARVGDYVAVDYVASIDGRELPQSRRENRLLEVGAGAVSPELDRALDGMRVGERRSVDVPFPEDHPDAALAGKSASLDVTLRGIREKVVPPVDDDLAREHGDCETLDDLRALLRRRMEESIAREAEEQLREELIGELISRNPFDVPRSFCDRQTEAVIDDILARSGTRREDLGADGTRLEEIRREVAPRAEHQVRAVLALDALGARLGIAVDDGEMEQRIEEMAGRAGENADKLRAAYRDAGARDALRARLAREHTLERLAAAAHVEEVDAPPPSE